MIIKDNLYFSPFIKDRDKKNVDKKLQGHKRLKKCVILICRQQNLNLLEIVDSKELYRLDKIEEGILVVGITQSNEEAVSWLVEKVQETMAHYNTVDKKTFKMELEQ